MAMNGLEKITDKILYEAEAEAARILADAERTCKEITEGYEAEAEQIKQRIAAEAEREGRELIARAKNAAEVEKRNALLSVKGELVDATFDETLASVVAERGEKYQTILKGLLTAAFLEQLEAEQISRSLYGEEEAMAPAAYEVLLSASDRERFGEALIASVKQGLLGKAAPERLERLTLATGTAPIDGGLILRCGEVESNCSLSLLFLQLRRELESEVSHALFDAKERL